MKIFAPCMRPNGLRAGRVAGALHVCNCRPVTQTAGAPVHTGASPLTTRACQSSGGTRQTGATRSTGATALWST